MTERNKSFTGFNRTNEKLFLVSLVFINFLIKAVPSGITELGNDEVYYWLYALYPNWSHFDHPPMVGLTIRFFTFNLALSGEFFIRLGSLVLSSASIIVLYYLVRKIYSVRAAMISGLLFTASLYCNIIAGFFILPDTPQVFLWLLAMFTGIPAVISRRPGRNDDIMMILSGLFTGLAFLSKYHSLFIWFGFAMYILLHNRQWLKRPALYISIILTMFSMLPVIYWNFANDFASFSYHSSRVGLFTLPVNFSTFIQFNAGEILYQNPVLIFVYVAAVLVTVKTVKSKPAGASLLLLYLSLPLILLCTVMSLFRNTLPHWSGPGFISLLILGSDWLAGKTDEKPRLVRRILTWSNIFTLAVLMAGTLVIRFGLPFQAAKDGRTDIQNTGSGDVTLDMYGWDKAAAGFRMFLNREGISEKDYTHVKVLSDKWFPAAHIDYYIAHPLGIGLIAYGPPESIHEYTRINLKRKPASSDRFFYITVSQYFRAPQEVFPPTKEIIPKDTIDIRRSGKIVKRLFIYEITGFTDDFR